MNNFGDVMIMCFCGGLAVFFAIQDAIMGDPLRSATTSLFAGMSVFAAIYLSHLKEDD